MVDMKECPFDLENDKAVEKFTATDLYNPQNQLKGYINKRQGHLYGSLWITHVNGIEVPQLIYSAPKQHYPFDKDKNWVFPECDYVDLYEKLDGTACISYTYKDSKGFVYLTFKTRLRPFLGSGKYGNFFELWNEMLKKYPKIEDYVFDEHHNCVFELYGKRNKILVEYDELLDTKLIFTINALNGQIYPPNASKQEGIDTIPVLDCKGMLIGWHDYNLEGKKEQYIKIQGELELGLKIDDESKIIKGEEGQVWYFMKTESGAFQIKNKPPSILKYHWGGDAIAYESIYTTVVNAFENFDNPVYENIAELLKEEFDDSKIEKSRVRIEKTLAKVFFEKKSTYEIMEYYKSLGVSILDDKGIVMRNLAKKFPKQVCCMAFPIVMNYEKSKVN